MKRKKIPQRTRFYLPVEGEGEQSFVKWIQYLSDQIGLHIHLDCQVLGGGGYETMLNRAIRYRSLKQRSQCKASILLVDADRAVYDDNWSLDRLKEMANINDIAVCFQTPNLEGLLLRLLPENKSAKPHGTKAHTLLLQAWPEYQKPADARSLISKFSLDDLLRVAHVDSELRNFLSIIGLYQ